MYIIIFLKLDIIFPSLQAFMVLGAPLLMASFRWTLKVVQQWPETLGLLLYTTRYLVF